MAYASWLNIAAANSRNAVLFRIYDAVANLLAGSMAGTWTIIDSVGTYTSEATPADGDYLVLECQSARSGGEKLQVFVGLRTSTGNLAGFGSKVAGVWICASPVAGWNSAAGYFGASLADWRNSLITVATGGTGAVNFGLILTSGTPGVRPGSLYTLARVTTGTQTACLGAVSLIPPTGWLTRQVGPCASLAELSGLPVAAGWKTPGQWAVCRTWPWIPRSMDTSSSFQPTSTDWTASREAGSSWT